MSARDELGPAVHIRLAADPERLCGSIRVDDGPERRFTGWLELMRAVEVARETAVDTPPRRDRP